MTFAMHPGARAFLIRWALTSVGVLVATQIVPGIHAETWLGLLVAALVLGLLNAFVRPVLALLTLPLVLVTFGLFLWVINAALLAFVGWLVHSFRVDSFWSALGGSAVISLVSWLTGSLLGLDRTSGPPRPPPPGRPPRRPGPPDGHGPVIDI